MIRNVHYMIRKPGASAELIYPSDLDEREDYYGYGAFVIAGRDEEDVDEIYNFLAIRETRAVPIKLERRTTTVFRAMVDGVGEFWFTARRIATPARYTGRYSGFEGGELIRQLAPADHSLLDATVRKHDFYFVGFTPKLDALG